MASPRKIKDHVTLNVSAAVSTALLLLFLKWALRQWGRSDLANDL